MDKEKNKQAEEDKQKKQKDRMLKLNRVVCICKGIPLKKVLPAIKKCETIEEVNTMAGTGQGGCQGRRCGPRIGILLKKKKQLQQKS